MLAEYKQYRLREPRDTDVDGVFEISHDADVLKYFSYCYCEDRNAARDQLKWCYERFENNSGWWIIADSETDGFIGDIGFSEVVQQHNRAMISFRILKEYRGRGITSAFIKTVVEYGLENLKYNRIEAQIHSDNIASKKTVLKNGFVFEGVLRQYEVSSVGSFSDMEMYSILKSDVP